MTALTHKENDLHNRLIVAELNLGQVEEELRRLHEENEALRARLAQPELGVTLTATKHPVSLGKPSEYKLSKESLEGIVLEREWQGLTEYEVGFLTVFDELYDVEAPLLANFIRHIEAKLKEKNT